MSAEPLEPRIAELEHGRDHQQRMLLSLNDQMTVMGTRIGGVESRLTGMESRLGRVENSVSNLERELGSLRLAVDTGFERLSAGLDQILQRLTNIENGEPRGDDRRS